MVAKSIKAQGQWDSHALDTFGMSHFQEGPWAQGPTLLRFGATWAQISTAQEFLNSWAPDGGQQGTGNDKAFNACKFTRHDEFNNPSSEQVVKKPAGGIINLR